MHRAIVRSLAGSAARRSLDSKFNPGAREGEMSRTIVVTVLLGALILITACATSRDVGDSPTGGAIPVGADDDGRTAERSSSSTEQNKPQSEPSHAGEGAVAGDEVAGSKDQSGQPEPSLIVVENLASPLVGMASARGDYSRLKRNVKALGYVAGIDHVSGGPVPPGMDTEAYDHVEENRFLSVAVNPLSTFSIDVDTASYANVRRFLNEGRMPPRGAVRIEEFINYFTYDYPEPTGEAPFSVDVEINQAPWNPDHRLARIGIRGESIDHGGRPDSNLVFLLDVSGSMQPANKLPLLRSAMKMLASNLNGTDRVAIVVYAGAAGLVLPSTPGTNRAVILDAIDRLEAGGSTAGGAGIRLAYETARANFIEGGVNRVILATDGDFNVGITNQSELVDLIRGEAAQGTFLSVLGFGTGNYKDSTLEALADKGNGNYAYIDGLQEARKVLVEQIGSTLVTIAKDVKIQVEFNPVRVAEYRLIGYENRALRDEDFNDDRKDAGEIGAGHTVTALYELVLRGTQDGKPLVDDLKYQRKPDPTEAAGSGELLTLKLRYKQPDGDTSRLLVFPVKDAGHDLASASEDFTFAAAVASFGMILQRSEHVGDIDLADIAIMARAGQGRDVEGYRAKFMELVEQAQLVVSRGAGR